MKNLIKSKAFIEAGIVAVLCIGIILIRLLPLETENLEFIPDDLIMATEPTEIRTENESSSFQTGDIEFIPVAQPIEAETTTSSEECLLEEYHEEEIILNLSDLIPVEIPLADEETSDGIILSIMPEKPTPPEPPLPNTGTGYATLEDVAAHKALDPKLTNPNVKPDGSPVIHTPEPKPIERNNPTAHNDTVNEDGIYFPGVGWLPYLGPNIGTQSKSDGDWTKIIGSMG